MPRQQLELAPGELVAREARSHHDLPDDADGGLWANLVMVGDGLLGGGGGSEGLGLLAPRGWWIPACRTALPPPVVRAAIVRFLLLATVARRSAQKLRSAKWCQSKIYDSNVCHIAPRVLEKCLVLALSALVENMKVLIGCE